MKLSDTKSFQRISVIYGIQCLSTSKWYIGSCEDLKDRMQRHRYYLRHNNHHSIKLQRAYNKYGEDDFNVEIIQFLNASDDRFKIEEEYIKKYDSVNNGYNIIDKCPFVEKFTLSAKAKDNFMQYIKTLEKSVIAINRVTGTIDGTFESVTEAANFYHTSTSNISSVCLGKLRYIKDHVFIYTKDFDETKDYRVAHHCTGKHKPEEQKEKMRHNKNCVKIYKIDSNNNVVKEFYSISEAARDNNIKADHMRYILNSSKPLNGFTYSRNIL